MAPNAGFTSNVAELARHAADLPQVAANLRKPLAILTEHTATPRPTEVAAVSAMEREYGTFTDELADRQRLACDRIDDTAQTLAEIAELYRRVDGQS
ncbi:MAG TPA: hypothetical protein VNP92_32500 [Actinophytocola sp.]|nr:hypothetical protein [Actinophytocola sp.]